MSSASVPAPRVPSSAVKRRLVVVGGPHSGAALVRCLLGAYPGIHDVGDSGLFVEIAGRPRRYRPWTLVGLSSGRERRLLGRLLARERDEAGPVLPPRDPRLSRAFGDAVATLDRMALSAGCRSWVEHTPGVPLQAAALERLIPRLRVVHVLRDGRDEVAAHCVRKARERGRGCRPAEAGDAVDRWNRAVAAHARCFGRRGHSYVLYEDLVQDPGRELRRLARDCGLEDDADAAAEAVAAVDLPEPRGDRARFRELLQPERRRRLEGRLDLERFGRLAERLRSDSLRVHFFQPKRPGGAAEPAATAPD